MKWFQIYVLEQQCPSLGLKHIALSFGLLSLLSSLIADVVCLCMAHISVSLCSHRYKRQGCNTSYQTDPSPHGLDFNFAWQLIMTDDEGGRQCFVFVFILCVCVC